MQSSTHTLIALAIFSRNEKPCRNAAIFIGSAIPDLFIYLGWLWLTLIRKEPQHRIWNEIYFQDPMQAFASAFNSVPLYIGLALMGLIFIRRKWAMLLYYFALAALVHIAFDFPLHAHDAYAYFEPFTSWRFHSPLSYYEAEHHGRWVGLAEIVIACGCIAILRRRFPERWVKIVLGLFVIIYAAQALMLGLAPMFGRG